MEKRSKTDRNRSITVDRISELPEPVIHDQIMPRLSRRVRVRISVLSKTWYHLYKTFPALDFDYVSFDRGLDRASEKQTSGSSQSNLELERVKSFKNHADESLQCFRLKKLSLHSLRVNLLYPGSVSDISSWIDLALECRVEKLKLHCSDYQMSYCLPRSVYFSTTLTTLELETCTLDQQLSLFTSLRKLALNSCRLKVDTVVLKRHDCPALESLTIDHCRGLKSLCISNHVRLQSVEVELWEPTIVDIVASPCLQKILFQGYEGSPWSKFKIDGCYGLKVLRLHYQKMKDEQFHDLISKLPLLEDLYLIGCDRLEAMQVSSPRLKTLLVVPCGDSRLKSIEISAPSLQNFMFISHLTDLTKPVEIKVSDDCCDGLETLVLFDAIMGDKTFHKLIAKFPQLQSLWIFGCDEFMTLEIPNGRLKRLHIARCSELKAVKVGSRELFEMHCRGREDLEISVPDRGRMLATGSLICDRMVNCTSGFKSLSLKEMLKALIKDKYIAFMMLVTCCQS